LKATSSAEGSGDQLRILTRAEEPNAKKPSLGNSRDPEKREEVNKQPGIMMGTFDANKSKEIAEKSRIGKGDVQKSQGSWRLKKITIPRACIDRK